MESFFLYEPNSAHISVFGPTYGTAMIFIFISYISKKFSPPFAANSCQSKVSPSNGTLNQDALQTQLPRLAYGRQKRESKRSIGEVYWLMGCRKPNQRCISEPLNSKRLQAEKIRLNRSPPNFFGEDKSSAKNSSSSFIKIVLGAPMPFRERGFEIEPQPGSLKLCKVCSFVELILSLNVQTQAILLKNNPGFFEFMFKIFSSQAAGFELGSVGSELTVLTTWSPPQPQAG